MACSAAEVTELSALLDNAEAARFLCARLQTADGAAIAAAAAADAVVGLDGVFVLFSAYLIFIMCAPIVYSSCAPTVAWSPPHLYPTHSVHPCRSTGKRGSPCSPPAASGPKTA